MLEAFDNAIYAKSTMVKNASTWSWACRVLAAWGHASPLPLTAEKVRLLGATLRAGGYRSFRNYLCFVRVVAERMDAIPAPEQVRRAIKDAERACGRGLGPPKQSEGIPLELLPGLPESQEAWVGEGPLWPRSLLILGTWFLLREVEASNARITDVAFSRGAGGLAQLTWTLPASKCDQGACGVERTHGCCCGQCYWGDSAPVGACGPWDPAERHLCPVRAAAFLTLEVLELRRARFPQVPLEACPLFPTASLHAATKRTVAATVVSAAQRLGLPVRGPRGELRFTGHALRVAGAQSLSRGGLDPWAVALLARHSSSAVFGYIRDAPLHGTSLFAGQALRGLLQQQAPGPPGSSSSPSGAAPVRGAPGPTAGWGPWYGEVDHALADIDTRLCAVELGLWPGDGPRARALAYWRNTVDAACQCSLASGGGDETLLSQAAAGSSGPLPPGPATPDGTQAAGPPPTPSASPPRDSGPTPGGAPPAPRTPGGTAAVRPPPATCGHPLVHNGASRVVHLVVPAGLLPAGAPGKSFCGWPYAQAASSSFVDEIPVVHKRICEKCFPGLRSKVKARLLSLAAGIAANLPPPPDPTPEPAAPASDTE